MPKRGKNTIAFNLHARKCSLGMAHDVMHASDAVKNFLDLGVEEVQKGFLDLFTLNSTPLPLH